MPSLHTVPFPLPPSLIVHPQPSHSSHHHYIHTPFSHQFLCSKLRLCTLWYLTHLTSSKSLGVFSWYHHTICLSLQQLAIRIRLILSHKLPLASPTFRAKTTSNSHIYYGSITNFILGCHLNTSELVWKITPIKVRRREPRFVVLHRTDQNRRTNVS